MVRVVLPCGQKIEFKRANKYSVNENYIGLFNGEKLIVILPIGSMVEMGNWADYIEETQRPLNLETAIDMLNNASRGELIYSKKLAQLKRRLERFSLSKKIWLK